MRSSGQARESRYLWRTSLFGLIVLRSNRHVQADSASRSFYTLLGCQVHKRIVAIQERLRGHRSGEICGRRTGMWLTLYMR